MIPSLKRASAQFARNPFIFVWSSIMYVALQLLFALAALGGSTGTGSGVNEAVLTGEVAALDAFRSEGRNSAKTSDFWSGAFTGFGVNC